MHTWNLSWCIELKLLWVITVSNLFSNLSNTKMPTLSTLCITWKLVCLQISHSCCLHKEGTKLLYWMYFFANGLWMLLWHYIDQEQKMTSQQPWFCCMETVIIVRWRDKVRSFHLGLHVNVWFLLQSLNFILNSSIAGLDALAADLGIGEAHVETHGVSLLHKSSKFVQRLRFVYHLSPFRIKVN